MHGGMWFACQVMELLTVMNVPLYLRMVYDSCGIVMVNQLVGNQV